MSGLPKLYTEAEAASYLGITPETLAGHRRAGRIGHIQVAHRRFRYEEYHLIQFLNAQTVQPKKAPAFIEHARLQELRKLPHRTEPTPSLLLTSSLYGQPIKKRPKRGTTVPTKRD